MIIDKILLPRLKRLPMDKKQSLLEEYSMFLISEREYFVQKTGYKAVTANTPQTSEWFKHYDVEQLLIAENAKEDSSNTKKLEKNHDIR